MCDGFSEAFLFAAGAEGGGLAAGVAATDAVAAGGTLATAGGYAGAAAGALGWGGAAALGAAATSGISAYTQGNAQQQAAKYQAQVANNNVKLAQYQQSSAIQQGQQQTMQSELQASQVLGEQKAALTSNGVSLGSGSAIDLLATTKFLNGQDVNAIQSNAARSAWGYGVDATNSQAEAGLANWQAKNTNPLLMGATAAGGSLLSTASVYNLGKNTNLFKSFT